MSTDDQNQPTKWEQIAAPLDPASIKIRTEPTEMPYIDVRDVYDRLNAVCPGKWEFRFDVVHISDNGDWSIKGILTIMGVTHEDVGNAKKSAFGGPDKAAVSDAIKRCAVHFGFATELYQETVADLKRKATGQSTPQQPQQPAQESQWPDRPWDVETLGRALDYMYERNEQDKEPGSAKKGQAGMLAGSLNLLVGKDKEARYVLTEFLTEYARSSKETSSAWASVLIDWAVKERVHAAEEARLVLVAAGYFDND